MVWLYQCLFNHSPSEAYLGCFGVLDVMNKAAINIIYRFLCEHKYLLILEKCAGVQLPVI